jgi:hypothetical protein
MQEMGVSSGTNDDSIKVEHVLVLTVSEKWERVIDKWVHHSLDLSRELVSSLRLVAAAASIALVLWGTSKLVTSLRTPHHSKDEDHDGGSDTKK